MIDKIFSNRVVIALFLTYIIVLFFYPKNGLQLKDSTNETQPIVVTNSALNPIDNCKGIDMKWWKSTYISGILEDLHRLERTEDLKLLLNDSLTIEKLNLSYSNFKVLPNQLFKFKSLKELDISNNSFVDKDKLFRDLGKLENLKVLICRSCNLWSLPNSISKISNIEALVLDRNGLTEVNEKIGELVNLKLLSFRNNSRLKDLPRSISDLTCLQQLNISGAGFTRIRDEITNCKNLKSILGNASKIRYLPDSIGKLTELRNLNLGHNKIEKIPESIGDLLQLENLSLGSNEIQKLPNEISNLKNLKSIGLQFNRFKEFPMQILDLKNLNNLWVHNNYIKEIPIEVAELPNLVSLLVDHEIITNENIEKLLKENAKLKVSRHDSQRYVKGKRRKN